MSLRGVQKAGTRTTTSALLGLLRDDARTRQEFLSLVTALIAHDRPGLARRRRSCIAVVLAVDQLRRPVAAWEAAGRERRFWVALTLVTGFHGLGQFSAVAYLAAVVPRFRTARPAGPSRRGAAAGQRGRRAAAAQRTAAESLALVAGLLVFASSVIHAACHRRPLRVLVAVGRVLPRGRVRAGGLVGARLPPPAATARLLRAGAIGNGALVVVWAFSRTAGMPVGPQPWRPRAGRRRRRARHGRRARGRRPARRRRSRSRRARASHPHPDRTSGSRPRWPGRCSSTASSRRSVRSTSTA